MPVMVKKREDNSPASRHSERLQNLTEEASRIREDHLAGKLSSEQAALELESLKRRHAGFLERLIDL